MAHAVLVFMEQRGGELKKSSLEALSAGRALADQLGGTAAAVVAGKGIDGLAGTIGAHGAAEIYVADAESLEYYSTEGYAAAASAALEKAAPAVFLVSGTAMGKDLAPRIAARLEWTFVADVTGAEVTDGKLRLIRPQYAGKTIWTLAAEPKNIVVTVRPNVFPVAAQDGAAGTVTPVDVSVSPRAKTRSVSVKEQGVIDVSEADRVVSGGRGLKEAENFSMIFDLAKELEAGVGASRAVVDAGWIDHDHQVGQTGKTVSPNLYIACGISGAIQHLAGMRTSKCIVAINKDSEAPIFQVADYGVVGDVFEVLPKLTEAVRGLKS